MVEVHINQKNGVYERIERLLRRSIVSGIHLHRFIFVLKGSHC